jgi:Na+/H+ antiporter NhaC
MDQKGKKIEFRFGTAGKLAPLIVAALMIGWAAFSQSNVNGYVLAFFAALVTGIIFAKDEKAYGEALVYGLGKPMFGVIVLAVILAAVSGKLISASGAVQTIAAYVVAAGFTGRLFVAAAFLVTCLLAFATGTSVGTYFVVIPILFPVGVMAGAAPEFTIGAIVSGAAFGDNLGPISDTTIASSATQHADLGTVVKTRMRYSLPAASGALILFLLFSRTTDGGAAAAASDGVANPVSLVMLAVPAVIIVLCMMRKHLITALSFGILAGIAAGLLSGVYTMDQLISFPGGFSVSGAIIEAVTGTAGTVSMLIAVFALLGVLECGGLFEDVRGLLERFARRERGSEGTIILSVGILSMVTGVISVAIVALGDLINEIGEKTGVNRYRRANLMDCAGCVFCFLAPWTVHCVIPAQLSSQFGEGAAVAPASIPFVNYYSICMLVILIVAVITGYGRKPPKANDREH